MDCFVNSGHRRLLSRVASNGHGPWQRHMRRALSSLCVGFSLAGTFQECGTLPELSVCLRTAWLSSLATAGTASCGSEVQGRALVPTCWASLPLQGVSS